MNPWDGLSDLIGWSLLALFGLVMIFLAIIVIGVLVVAFKKMLPQKKILKPLPNKEAEYLEDAVKMGVRLYGESPNPSLEAFRAGARWGWACFSRR